MTTRTDRVAQIIPIDVADYMQRRAAKKARMALDAEEAPQRAAEMAAAAAESLKRFQSKHPGVTPWKGFYRNLFTGECEHVTNEEHALREAQKNEKFGGAK